MSAVENCFAMLTVIPPASNDIKTCSDVNHRCEVLGFLVRLFKQHMNALQSFETKNA